MRNSVYKALVVVAVAAVVAAAMATVLVLLYMVVEVVVVVVVVQRYLQKSYDRLINNIPIYYFAALCVTDVGRES